MKQDILLKISESVAERLKERQEKISFEELSAQSLLSRKLRSRDSESFISNLKKQPKSIIAEIKFRSPSRGNFGLPSHSENAVKIAGEYMKNGAQALSVLTERDHFEGDPRYLKDVRNEFPEAYLLMKDFILTEYQIYEALLLGADAILLIVALLGEEATGRLLKVSEDLGLAGLVEVHDENELEIAKRVKARLIGINNRSLRSLEVSLETSKRLVNLAPRGVTLVSESGLESQTQLENLSKMGFQAFLMGTHFMKTGQPGKALREFRNQD